jgi:endonuclease/exonuclease/phosphatase family metal-dependent hydrolase
VPNKVYDDSKQGSKPGQHDDLGINAEQRQAEVSALNKQFAAPDAVTTKEIKEGEENPTDDTQVSSTEQQQIDQLGRGYGEESERFAKSKGLLRKVVASRRRNIVGGGLLGGGLIGLLLFMFLALPLKVQHIMNNLQSTFFAAAEEAVDDMSDNLFKHYVVKQLVPGMVQNNCVSTRINRSCVNTSNSDTIIGVLYNGWRDGRLEQRMANSGIEIRKEGSQFYLKTPSTQAGSPGESLGNYDVNNPSDFNQSAFQKLSRNDIRKEVKRALKQETKWDRVMYRYKVGRLMERKYGVTRCIIACAPRDRFKDSIEDKKLAFKAYFLERVIEPRNEMMGLVLECAVLGGFNCVEERDANDRGERLSQYELDVQAKLAEFRDKHGDRKLSELRAEADRVRQLGALEYMIDKVAGPMVSKTLGKAIPIVGWVDLAAMFVESGRNIGPAITKMTYVTNAATMAATYGMYRTNADEIKTGDVDAAAVGSVATSFSPTDGVDRKDQNGVGAEGSLLYGAIMGSGSRTVAFNPFSQKAYAAAYGYGCEDDNGNPPPSGELVCRVERLDNKTTAGTIANTITDVFKNNPAGFGGGLFVSIWNATGGAILDLIDSALEPFINAALALIPGDPIAKFMALIRPMIESIMEVVIKPIISDSASGARMFNMAAGGADVIANDFAHYNLGGAKISDEEAFAIRQERANEQLEEFNGRTMFARMFSTDTHYSLVSKLALANPAGDGTGLVQSMFSTITNPFAVASTSLVGFGMGSQVNAAPGLTKSPFGVTQVGYAKNDIVFTQDPEKTFKDEKCDDPETIKTWGNRAVNNTENEMPEHEPGDVNRCLLINAGAGSAGALFTDDVLPADELGATETVATPPTGSGESFTVATYNVLQGIHHYDKLCDAGEGPIQCIKRRSALQAKIITGTESDAELGGEKKHDPFDIVGMQEVSPEQYNELKGLLGPKGYAAFPLNDNRIHNQKDGSHAIFYNTAKFSLVESGKAPGLSNVANTPNNGNITVPWVGLTTAEGKKVYLVSVHWPVENFTDPSLGDVDTLKKGVQLTRDWVQTKAGPDATVIVVGDFNDSPEQRTTYCGLTRGGLLQHALDMQRDLNPETECPSIGTLSGIDHIYSTPTEGLSASDWTRMKEQNIIARASDHAPAYVTYSFAAAGVIGGDDYKEECGDYGVACDGECVDFVKFRLKKHIDRNKFDSLGNGKDVASGLGSTYGYKVDNTPAVNSVVSWPAGGVQGSSANKTYGHVAMVSKVNSDGSIVVEEYNYDTPYGYGTRTIPASAAKLLTYAHTEVDYR